MEMVFSSNAFEFNRRPCLARRQFGERSMIRKLTHVLMALTMAFGLAISSAPQAEAGHGRGLGIGLAAGIIGLGILGASANARGYGHRSYSSYDDGGECYRGPRECHWAGRRCFENRWGDTVCRGGRYVCERALICE
jgi:hypothetical protein